MRRPIIPYNKNLKERARELRKNSTPGEIEVWLRLKNNQLMGYDFDRQRPILNYIVDFYCKDLKLAIEIDGTSHDHKLSYDQSRTEELLRYGVSVLRFTEEEARSNTDYVIREMEKWIAKQQTKSISVLKAELNPPLNPLQGGERLTESPNDRMTD